MRSTVLRRSSPKAVPTRRHPSHAADGVDHRCGRSGFRPWQGPVDARPRGLNPDQTRHGLHRRADLPSLQIRRPNPDRRQLQCRGFARVSSQPHHGCTEPGSYSAPTVLGERLIGDAGRVRRQRPLKRKDFRIQLSWPWPCKPEQYGSSTAPVSFSNSVGEKFHRHCVSNGWPRSATLRTDSANPAI